MLRFRRTHESMWDKCVTYENYIGWWWWWCTALVFNNDFIMCTAPLKTSNGLTRTSFFLFKHFHYFSPSHRSYREIFHHPTRFKSCPDQPSFSMTILFRSKIHYKSERLTLKSVGTAFLIYIYETAVGLRCISRKICLRGCLTFICRQISRCCCFARRWFWRMTVYGVITSISVTTVQ